MTPFTVYSEATGEVMFSGAGSGVAAMQLDPGMSILIGAKHEGGWIGGDGQHQDVPARPSAFHDWDWGAKAWVAQISRAKDDAWRAVKSERNRREFGPFVHAGRVYDGDAAAQRRINLAVLGAQSAISGNAQWSIDWTLADNSVATLSAHDMVAVAESLGDNITAAHEWSRGMRAQIEAAETVEQVAEILSTI